MLMKITNNEILTERACFAKAFVIVKQKSGTWSNVSKSQIIHLKMRVCSVLVFYISSAQSCDPFDVGRIIEEKLFLN